MPWRWETEPPVAFPPPPPLLGDTLLFFLLLGCDVGALLVLLVRGRRTLRLLILSRSDDDLLSSAGGGALRRSLDGGVLCLVFVFSISLAVAVVVVDIAKDGELVCLLMAVRFLLPLHRLGDKLLGLSPLEDLCCKIGALKELRVLLSRTSFGGFWSASVDGLRGSGEIWCLFVLPFSSDVEVCICVGELAALALNNLACIFLYPSSLAPLCIGNPLGFFDVEDLKLSDNRFDVEDRKL